MRLFLISLFFLLFSFTNSHAENADPISITTQPISQLECEGNSVKFKVIASGSGLTYIWQYKKITDASFITILVGESNTSYPSSPSLEEIKIANVGSAQFPNGTQFQVIVSDGNSSVTSNVATLTVNEIKDVSGGTNVIQCFGTNYSYTVTTSFPENLVSFQWKKSVASGVWNDISDGGVYSGAKKATLTITGGTPAETGEYRVYITFKSSGADCNVTSTNRNRKITFLPKLTTPVVKLRQPACLVSTGTIAVAIQSATDVYSFDNGEHFQSSNEKSGLAAGNYTVIIKNSAGCISPSQNCQIIGLVGQPSIWDGATWLNGSPEISRGIIFEKDFNSTSDLQACSCQVTHGAKVVVNGTHTLTVTDAVDVVDGTLTFENNASLLQTNEGPKINSGNIIYKRTTTPVNRYDYTYWSSPVERQTLKKLSPATFFDKYFSYNNGWVVSKYGEATMIAGNGYIIRAPQTHAISENPLPFTGNFEGKPNNGVVSVAIAANSTTYLLGNPYPSAISADAFLNTNSAILEGTLYFWTHNTAPAAQGTTTYKYTTSDYATYNKTGGVATGHGKAAGTGGLVPNGNIAAGQGFFAPTSADGGIVQFNNTMRVSGGILGENNSHFFKTNKESKNPIVTSIEKNRIWLNLTNKEGVFKQMLVGYITAATNNYEGGFDAVSYNGNEFVDFYSINKDVNLAIQGRALPFTARDSVVLGYNSKIEGDFLISIDHTDGVLNSQKVLLEDKDLQLFHDLTKAPYFFTTPKGVFNSRFVLRYGAENKLEEIVEVKKSKEVLVLADQGAITIHSPKELLDKVVVYDAIGRRLFYKNKIAAQDFVISNFSHKNQMLLVHVLLSNGKKINRKIMY